MGLFNRAMQHGEALASSRSTALEQSDRLRAEYLSKRVEDLEAKLFSLQKNYEDLGKWHEKHKDDAALVDALFAFIRHEGAAAKFVVWQAMREYNGEPKPPAETGEEG